jgi:hypothetical protein
VADFVLQIERDSGNGDFVAVVSQRFDGGVYEPVKFFIAAGVRLIVFMYCSGGGRRVHGFYLPVVGAPRVAHVGMFQPFGRRFAVAGVRQLRPGLS